jgi:hypothetical protein
MTVLRALQEAVERLLFSPAAAPARRPLRREPQPAASALPVPGAAEAQPGQPSELYPARWRPSKTIRTARDPLLAEGRLKPPRSAPGAQLGGSVTACEVTQFTYFQGVGGIEVDVVSGVEPDLWAGASGLA